MYCVCHFDPFKKKLLSIGYSAFYDYLQLYGNIIIPDGVQTIDIRAFSGCEGFDEYRKLPLNIDIIPAFLFFCCYKISGALNIPVSVKEIQKNAFTSCRKLSGKLTIPS